MWCSVSDKTCVVLFPTSIININNKLVVGRLQVSALCLGVSRRHSEASEASLKFERIKVRTKDTDSESSATHIPSYTR